jgi:hypothetical protein
MDKHTNDTAPQVAPRKSAIPRDLAALANQPADASLLRAVAADVEAEDSGYVYGEVTAAQLRKLAERLDGEPLGALSRVLDKIDAEPDAEHEIVFIWACTPDDAAGHANVAASLSLVDAAKLLQALRAGEDGGER